MRKSLKMLFAIQAAAIAVALCCSDASAVTWDNAWFSGDKTDAYLSESYGAGGIQLGVSGFPNMEWNDTKYSDGAWTEVNKWSGHCLDSNSNGKVYPHGCIGGDRYQRWYEISTPTGWALEDEATGLFLDCDNSHGVYTNRNYGDRDSHQRWH
ncbi:RICIN domain-containing protein [Streptomyces sp. NPDC020800]|uniref:RICIN domain-containing protein n=1 Tax=Streptomyces sp. NPDC020800 TaxID=3365092 RepID=UPI0037A2E8E7